MTITCGIVIAARNAKNKLMKLTFIYIEIKYTTKSPSKDIIQFNRDDFKYFEKLD